jgi:hypothetical protein
MHNLDLITTLTAGLAAVLGDPGAAALRRCGAAAPTRRPRTRARKASLCRSPNASRGNRQAVQVSIF